MTNQNSLGRFFNKDIRSAPTYELCTSFSNLCHGLAHGLQGKLTRPKYYRFALDQGAQIYSLYQALRTRSYQPKPCHHFEVFCRSGNKTRLISEPAAIDNILHHALYLQLYWYFDRRFIFDSYGCRIGKGTRRSSDRCQYFMRHATADSYCLQLDVRKFYYSIDHNILRQTLEHHLTDPELVNLLMMLVNNEDGVSIGLNVGAMLSQLFGLIYLNELDHYIKRVLKVKRYVRYVDDMVIIGQTKEECLRLREQITSFLQDRLKLSLSKANVFPITQGINFVGYRTWRERRLVRTISLKRFHRNLKRGKIKSLQAQLAHAQGTASRGYMLRMIKEHLTPEQIAQFTGDASHDLLL